MITSLVLDAAVEGAISVGSIWAAGAAGAAIGTAVGTIVPGAGNAVGAAAGFIIGIGIYIATDTIMIDGGNLRTHAKNFANRW
jgi:hypothetical protein